jgi:type III secretion system low calcium response chaperone LcrH/SycD
VSKKIKITDLLNPKYFNKHEDVLMSYFEKGGTWQDLLGYDQNVLQSQYKKAYDFYQKADYKNAASAFSYLTMLNPYEYNYWMGLGISKQSDRLYEEAIVSYTAAEAMDPENPLPHLHLAHCFYALNMREEAIKYLNSAIEIAGEHTEYKEVRLKASTILKHLPK